MSAQTGAGSVISIGKTYGTSKNMTAITNASPAVATLEASHGVAVNDVIEITSGWGSLTGRVVRVSAVATNDVTLEGVDTTDTVRFPTGGGTGTVREVTAWDEVGLVKSDSLSPSGGEMNYVDATPLSARDGVEIPTYRSPSRLAFEVMDTSAGLTTAKAAGDNPVAFRIAKGPRMTLGNARWSVGDVPKISGTGVTTYPVSLAFAAQPVSY